MQVKCPFWYSHHIRLFSGGSETKCQLHWYRYQKRMSNIIDDVLEWSPRLALSGMMEKQPDVANATEANGTFSDGSKTNPDEIVPPDADAETGNVHENDQHQHQHQHQDNI